MQWLNIYDDSFISLAWLTGEMIDREDTDAAADDNNEASYQIRIKV